MSDIRLFDTRENDFPKDGLHFRTLQVFTCPICDYKTNLVRYIAMAQIGIGGRIHANCAYNKECWHHALEDAMHRYKIKTEEGYILDRWAQQNCWQKDLDKVAHDITGKVDETQIIELTGTRAPLSKNKPCTHCNPNRLDSEEDFLFSFLGIDN